MVKRKTETKQKSLKMEFVRNYYITGLTNNMTILIYLDGFDWVTRPTVSNPIVLIPQVTHILPLL